MPPTLAGETQETPPGLPWAGEPRALRDKVFGGHRAAPRERGTEGAAVRSSKKAPRWKESGAPPEESAWGPSVRRFVGFRR